MFLHLSPLWGMTVSLIGDFNAVGMKGMGERLRQESSAGSLVLCLFSKTASYIWRHKPGSTHTQMRRTDVHTQTHTQTCTHCGLRQLSEHTKIIYSCVDTRCCRHIVVIDAHTHTQYTLTGKYLALYSFALNTNMCTLTHTECRKFQ